MKDTTPRVRPASGTLEQIGILKYDDIIDGVSDIKGEQMAVYGHPARMRKLVATSTAAVGTEFPYDGATATAQAGASGTITLAADAPAVDISGLLIVIVSGTGAGQVRRIASYVTGTKVATMEANWATPPDSSSVYRILIDCFRFSELHVKAEFANAASTDPMLQVLAMLYDYPDTSGGLFSRAPIRYPDYTMDIENLDFVDNPAEATYRIGRVRTVPIRGALGAKIRMMQIPTGAYSLWASAT